MEKKRLIFNSPTNDELKVLKHFLPKIKAQAESEASTDVKAKRGALVQKFCGICGESLIDKQKRSPNPKLCKECDEFLTAGQTALVTMDGRYAFVQSDGSEEAKAIAGKIIPVESKLLDEMAQKQGIEIKENPNVKNN